MRTPAEYPKESTRSRRLRAAGVVLSLLVMCAAVGLVVALWTGTGTHHESYVHAERLPWPHEGFAPLPGVAAPFEIFTRTEEQSRITWVTAWDVALWRATFLGLMFCAFSTYWVERKRSRRVEPLALLAACFALIAANVLKFEADALAMDASGEISPFAIYRVVQDGIGGAIVLQIVTAVVASAALVRIARKHARRGLPLALFSLFSAPYMFLCTDIVFLAPFHVDASYAVTEMRLARAENASLGWVRSGGWRIAVSEDGRSATRYSYEDSGRSPALIEYEGVWSDAALLETLDEIVERFPTGCWVTLGPSTTILDIDVMLEVDESVRFGQVRPILRRLRELGAPVLMVMCPPPAVPGPPFFLHTWLQIEDSDLSSVSPASVELVPSARAGAPAEVLLDGVRYEHAGAAAADVRARAGDDDLLGLQVDDEVPWRDVVHAIDAFWPRVSLDP